MPLKHSLLVDVLVLLLLFSASILNSFLYIVGKEIESGQLSVIYFIVFILSVLFAIFRIKVKTTKRFLLVISLFLLIAISFILTYVRFAIINDAFFSEFKLFAVTSLTILMLDIILINSGCTSINLRLITFFNLISTIILFMFIMKSLSQSNLIHDESGFLYQNVSYYSSFFLGLSFFLSYEFKRDHNLISYYFMFPLMLVQFYICIQSGGRGGCILAFVLMLYYLFVSYGLKGFLISIPFTFLVLFIISHYFSSVGVERSLSLFGGEGLIDENRELLRASALLCFEDSPFLGKGIGSVFYLIGIYSHNFVTDMLCEIGLLGTILFSFVLFFPFLFFYRYFNLGSLYRFCFIILICGLVKCFFSGYIWVEQFVLFPVSLFLSQRPKKSL